MRRTRVKVCCIASFEEAALAVEAGADVLGLVGPMPTDTGVIGLALAGEIAARVPPGVTACLLSSSTDAADLAREAEAAAVGALQIVDEVDPKARAVLRARLPALRLIQVVHVEDETALDGLDAAATHAQALLLDSGRPRAAARSLGGTGRVHDWTLSRRIVDRAPCPVWLAGGLKPDNVGAAVRAVRPFGVDLCTGIRREGRLDPGLLHAFMAAVRRADLALEGEGTDG